MHATHPVAAAPVGLEKDELRLGFVKLTDMAPLAIAYELGYFEDEGLYVTLEPQANWKVLLDRVISGELDGAHMLAGQPLAATIGLGTRAHAENVALGVERVYPHATRAERAEIVRYYLARVGLAAHADKPARELSNGMKQRVGIARAFALSPKLLLLDEPFGMLDSLTRWELQELLMEVWTRTQVTAICVTHDVDEAILLADRVVMMTAGPNAKVGRVMKVDLPRPRTHRALLDHPDYYRYRREVLDFLAGGAAAHRSEEAAA